MPAEERVLLLAGGVGGARMAEGLAACLPAGALTIVANVGDDETFYGLHVSPDVDTLIYTLSGRIDRSRGWGVAGDGLRAQGVLADLGAPVWMQLGDSDLGLHIWRSWQLAQGRRIGEITEIQCARFGARARVLPVTDDRLRTKLMTADGWMDFQSWFVGARCAPRVEAIEYRGAGDAPPPADSVLEAISAATTILIAPSNPLLSIGPILAVPGVVEALRASSAPKVAVSPLIGGKAVKGPLAQLIRDLGLPPGAQGIAIRYREGAVLDGFVLDRADRDEAETLSALGLPLLRTDILIPTPDRSAVLSHEVLGFARGLRERRIGGGG